MSEQRRIIVKPIITEKATMLREGNKYVFRVDKKANKIQIRQAIESIFDVHVESARPEGGGEGGGGGRRRRRRRRRKSS